MKPTRIIFRSATVQLRETQTYFKYSRKSEYLFLLAGNQNTEKSLSVLIKTEITLENYSTTNYFNEI